MDPKRAGELVQTALQFSHSTIVLLLCSIVEAALVRAIKSKMRELSNNQERRLFEGYGPLATFSAKIDMGHALSVVDDATLADLRVIREIRNQFAHPDRILHFDDAALAALTDKFASRPKDKKPIQIYVSKITECIERTQHGMSEEPELKKFLDGLRELAEQLGDADA